MLESLAAEDYVKIVGWGCNVLDVSHQPARPQLSRLCEGLSFANSGGREISSADFGSISEFSRHPAGKVATPAANFENAAAFEIVSAQVSFDQTIPGSVGVGIGRENLVPLFIGFAVRRSHFGIERRRCHLVPHHRG